MLTDSFKELVDISPNSKLAGKIKAYFKVLKELTSGSISLVDAALPLHLKLAFEK